MLEYVLIIIKNNDNKCDYNKISNESIISRCENNHDNKCK